MRSKDLVFGLLLLILGLGVWFVTTIFELGTANALVGVLAGVVLGLTRDRSPLARYGAFLIGLVFGLCTSAWNGRLDRLGRWNLCTDRHLSADKGSFAALGHDLGRWHFGRRLPTLLLSSPWFVLPSTRQFCW